MNRKCIQRVPSGRSGQGRASHASALVGSGKCWVKYDMSVGCLWEVLSLPHLGLALGAAWSLGQAGHLAVIQGPLPGGRAKDLGSLGDVHPSG